MPRLTDSIKIGDAFLKRSSKLLPCQKEMVGYLHNKGSSINSLAKMFKVSKRTIQFIIYPERLKKNVELRNERGGSSIYYQKEVHTKAIKEHREYKKQLFKY
jgi:Mor family transcriptional regulator